MKVVNAINLMKENVSRGIMLEGMGCITYFVPERDCEMFIKVCEQVIPLNVYWSVGTLKDNKITMKKGLYEVGRLRDGGLQQLSDKYFKGEFVETRVCHQEV
ncbi:hypothetical protein AXI64_gp023 [Vibrio phage qdvp001]|uniref:hypothetical protein n=1 Tax=Vibrio phage qdvp001 TaxID=1003177 RepID=UPI000720D369|nr:hypothetical protein AXI64_gp023 [Vibrio phage qdvp001]ALM62015.1 hypothetical protein qdvp001_023 [Vibrio phage qdvp001]